MLDKIKRLNEIKDMKDVEGLSKARYPGTHCPLFGATMLLKNFKDSAVIILGTQECTYYTKNMVSTNEDFYNRCFSVVTNQHDITFGASPKVEQAIDELLAEEKPKSIFVVTTCVIEVIGDDIDSVALDLTDKYDIPIMVVHTEHFRCDSHIGGMTNVLQETVKIMKEMPKEKCVNIVGHRHKHFEQSELYNILNENGIKINLNVPAICNTDDIRSGAKAMLNIVCDDIGIKFATHMKEKFGTEYVNLCKSCDLDEIYSIYEKIFKTFDIKMPEKILKMKDDAKVEIENTKKDLIGASYIYGNTPINTFSITKFLTDLGMEAKLVQTKEIKESDYEAIEYIKNKGQNPYITKSANIAPLQDIYDILKPTFYIGHENSAKLAKKGIIQIALDSSGEKIGFEMPVFIAKMLAKYYMMRKKGA